MTPQGHAAWEVLTLAAGQLRLGPRGHVLGLDLGAALAMGVALGHDAAALALLLPAGEEGVVQGYARCRGE